MSDASLGVTNPGYRPGDTATALPAGSRWVQLQPGAGARRRAP